MNLETHPAFLVGFLDAVDMLARPSADYRHDRLARAAWQAGYDRFAELVQHERERLESMARSAGGHAV